MKILFICGSLQPGCDGVGDYTRRLTAELIRDGHECSIIALNDRMIGEIIVTNQESEGIQIAVFRLPAKMPAKERFRQAGKFIEAFNPEWLSLQYVPFSFHPKGLPFGLGLAINKLIKGRKLHIMFHELWVGMDTEVSIKFNVWGKVQKAMIGSFVKNVKPSSIHTHTKLYQWQLNKLGVNTTLLPLFSNIKVFDFNLKINNSNLLRFVLFGNIHSGAPVESFGNRLSEYSKRSGIGIEIIFIGRCGSEQQKWIEMCKSKEISIKVLGEQSLEKVSETLNNADFGITTTPLLLTEKSGTVAAMREHGLPILCVSKLWNVVGFLEHYTPIGIQVFKEEDIYNYLLTKKTKVVTSSISCISKQFLDSLFKS
jgi:hypothetical protein